jgi:hypothetical protein
MPPHLKILSDLRKAKRKKNNARRTGSSAAVAAGGSPAAKDKGLNGPPGPLTQRVDKLATIIASPPHRKPGGGRPQTQPSKAATRTRGK